MRLVVNRYAGLACALWWLIGCASDQLEPPNTQAPDAASSAQDAEVPLDAGSSDASMPTDDAGAHDAAASDDAGPRDAGSGFDPIIDAAIDAGPSAPPELAVPEALPPSHLGILVGPGARAPHEGLRLYGTDLGISFEHAGELQMLFGDSWAHEAQVCEDAPVNDDTLARMPLALGLDLPELRFATHPDAPREALAIELLRAGESLTMGFGQVPMAAFSDGQHAFAFFARLAPQTCDVDGRCGREESLSCSERIGECQPAFTTMTLSCDLETGFGCLPGQECTAGAPVCVDPTSAQYDGSSFGETSAIAQQVELAVQGQAVHAFRSVLTWPTSKFATLAARTVERFTGGSEGNDYKPGHGELLVWGRPGFIGEHGREAQLYLLRHGLPLALDEAGAAAFSPRYFAGLDPETLEPTWTKDQARAAPLALDGITGGDPHEELSFTGQMAVSWLPAPIEKWAMLYGGDITDFLMVDAAAARSPRASGAIMIRFADHPWGPWSLPEPHVAPGAPGQHGALYGPGGLLYHPDCAGTEQARCAASDPWRPPDTATACLIPTQMLDPGRLYGVNIIDKYTRATSGALELVWNVSLWNPYAVALMRTRVLPPRERGPVSGELADALGLRRMSDFSRLPELDPGRRYRQQSSRDRGSDDTSFPLSGSGNRDFNNFLCKSADAELAADQFAPFHFDQAECEESYVRGAVLARFEGPGRHVRTWIGIASLMFAPADEEIFRVYVDDEEQPRIEAPLAAVLDGSAGEIFAPPFGAGSPRRMSWYYPIAFEKKLIVTLDKLGAFDEYFFHCDVVHDASASPFEPATRDDRQRAIAELANVYHPAGRLDALAPLEGIELAPNGRHPIELEGPATIYELELRASDAELQQLAAVRVRVRWDEQPRHSIDVSLLELFAASPRPPELSTLALTSFVEGDERVLVLKLPMPFESTAELVLENTGPVAARFAIAIRGTYALPPAPFGKLHVIASALETGGDATHHHSLALEGRGRLAGACAYLAGVPDPDGGLQYDGLNLLEGDVRIWTDGALALDGTGTEEYADDVFYFADVPHGNAFVQAWGVVNDPFASEVGEASLCRWHVLGTELDFERSLHASFELGGAGNPEIAREHRVVSYVYLEAPML